MIVIMDYILSQTLKILYFVRLFNLGETIHYVPGKLRACRFLARFCAGVTNFFIPENAHKWLKISVWLKMQKLLEMR